MNYLINHVVELEIFALASKSINSRNIKNVEASTQKILSSKTIKNLGTMENMEMRFIF